MALCMLGLIVAKCFWDGKVANQISVDSMRLDETGKTLNQSIPTHTVPPSGGAEPTQHAWGNIQNTSTSNE
eukprot:5435251-Amphidinium_carterae.1